MYDSELPRFRHYEEEAWTAAEDGQLVAQLNDLMEGLHLPISIIAPTDLTPSLLIAVLESLLGEKIPIPYREQTDLKLQKVKVFLGVLETDVLQQAVGLSDIDPRKLADGAWDEVVFVAEVLVWVGRHVGLIQPQRKKKNDSLGPSEGPSNANSTVKMHRTASGRFSSPELDTTSVFYAPPAPDETPSSVALSLDPPFEVPPPFSPQVCTSSLLFSRAPSVSPVRLSGYIQPVDEEVEIASFEMSLSPASSNNCNGSILTSLSRDDDTKTHAIIAIEEQYLRTLKLLEERDRLLKELEEMDLQNG